MKINLTSHIDTGCSKKFNIISNLDNILELYFKNKSYDENLETILVSIIAIKRIAGYENWYKPRRPRYIFHKQIKDRIIKGNTIEINKTYECEFRLSDNDYERFISVSDKESKLILGSYIFQILSDLEYLCRKLKQFEKDEFLIDLKKCLKKDEYL